MRALLLAASALSLCAGELAHAQSIDGIRGEVTEQEITNQLYETLLPKRRKTEDDLARRPTGKGAADAGDTMANGRPKTTTPPEEYEPASLGGLTQAEEDKLKEGGQLPSIFDEPETDSAADDPFADAAPIPTPRARPKTANDRAEETNERAMSASQRSKDGPETAEDRNRPPGAEGEEEDLTTGTVRAGTIDSETEDELTLDRGAERASPIEGLDIDEEENPYEAVGLRVGGFILRPSVEQGLTATTNANSSVNGSSAILSETSLRLNAVSDWSQHSATLNAFGNFRKSVSGQELDETRGGADATFDYQLSHEYQLKSALSYTFEPESASSPDAVVGVSSQPTQHNLDGSIGLAKDLGKLRLGVTGKVQREWYGDATLTDGEELSLSDRNSTLASLALRTGYEISPALRPFVELEGGRRIHDEKIDASGFERSSNILAARAGIEVERGDKLTGEISAGWLRETFDDDRLESISGPSLNANLRWSPERGTTVGLTGSTSVDSTTTEGESGSLLYTGRLTLEREIRTNLTANAALGLDLRDYSGSSDNDLTFLAEAGATWWLNRYAGLTGRARYETLRSDLPDRDYDATSVFLGLRLQR